MENPFFGGIPTAAVAFAAGREYTGNRPVPFIQQTAATATEGVIDAMAKRIYCESCTYYIYDEDWDCYTCQMNLDEDEMERFLGGSFDSCPYYRLDDEYGIVRKQM